MRFYLLFSLFLTIALASFDGESLWNEWADPVEWDFEFLSLVVQGQSEYLKIDIVDKKPEEGIVNTLASAGSQCSTSSTSSMTMPTMMSGLSNSSDEVMDDEEEDDDDEIYESDGDFVHGDDQEENSKESSNEASQLNLIDDDLGTYSYSYADESQNGNSGGIDDEPSDHEENETAAKTRRKAIPKANPNVLAKRDRGKARNGGENETSSHIL